MPDIGFLGLEYTIAMYVEWVTTIIAFVAFIVAVLSLWFSSLKGPDIDLCESPKFVMEKIRWENLNYIPDRIRFSPAQLIFINNGTRSGVIKLEANFEPSDEFKPFLSRAGYIFKIGEKSWSDDMPHISMRERESCIIEVEVRVDFDDWKEYFDSDPVSKEKIYDILCKADLVNFNRLSDFCSLLRPAMSVGKVTINSVQTIRKNILWTRIGRKNLVRDLPIGLIDQKFIEGFKSCLAKWDSIEPNCILMKLEALRKDLSNYVLTPLGDNLNKLGQTPRMALRTDFWNDWKKKWEGYTHWKALIDFILKSSGLESKIEDLCLKADGFNQDLRIFEETRSTDSQQRQAKDWDLGKNAEIVRNKIRDIMSDIESLQEILYKCVHSI